MLGATSMDLAGGGDIWSTGVFSFESPIKDLLDSNDFTLEQLLAEDELLQELRGCHQKLMSYFSTEQAITKLVTYVILPQAMNGYNPAVDAQEAAPAPAAASDSLLLNGGSVATCAVKPGTDTAVDVGVTPKEPGEWLRLHLESLKSGTKNTSPEKDPALKHIRFPYMACEIICCELPGVIDTLVEGTCVFEDANSSSDIEAPSAEIVTSESQSDMVEVVAKHQQQATSTKILDLLFSLLHETPAGQLDDYRAGYFDKILTVLFRKRPEDLTTYINTGGSMGRDALIKSMLKHLYSHSIMQIAQRLLLPQRPNEQQQLQQQQQQQQQQEGDEIVAGDEDEMEGVVQCDWGESPHVINMLLDILIGPERTSTRLEEAHEEQLLDLSLNASEVLITIIQNSLLSSPTMLSLTSEDTVTRIVDAATTLSGDYFSPHESLLTSAMNVLESLVLQLGGYGAVGTMSLMAEEELAMQQQMQMMQGTDGEGLYQEDPPDVPPQDARNADVAATATEESIEATSVEPSNPAATADETELMDGEDDGHLISDLGSMLEILPRLLRNLSNLLRHPSTKQWMSPMQFSKTVPQQMLGNSRLRIVRVLESLVLLGDPDVDSRLVQSDCLEICLDFFWEFQWCSMLHQSVANLLVHVFEGQNTRFEMQQYFLVKCDLLGRLMDSFVEDEENHANAGVATGMPHSVSTERILDVVENLQDITIAVGTDAPLTVSEDDVDAALETQQDDDVIVVDADQGGDLTDPVAQNTGLVSTEAVRYESRDVSTVGDVNSAPPAQVFRFGYMGHVIIICQALVHAYTNDPQEQEMTEGEVSENVGTIGSFGIVEQNGYVDKEGAVVHGEDGSPGPPQEPSETPGVNGESDGEGEGLIGPRDDFGEPLLLFEIVHTHTLADRWHEFVDTTLAAETAVQSTPLGGYSMQAPGMDPMQSHRPGLADEGYMMGDDGEGPPAPPRGMLGGGEVIDMDDNDLDIAASMMAGLSLARPTSGEADDDNSNSESVNSGDSERSYNSGETASEKSGYAFDDPLGKAGELGIELGKLTQVKVESDAAADAATSQEDDNGSHSSSDEEPESQQTNDVPVMDLFAGNFDQDGTDGAPAFANFADFDSADSSAGDAFGTFPAPASGSSSATTADIDDIFGSGDHAELLEQDDPVEPLNPFADPALQAGEKTSAIDDGFGKNIASIIGTTGKAVHQPDEEVGTLPPGQDELLMAPSDELRADMSETETEAPEKEKVTTTKAGKVDELAATPENGKDDELPATPETGKDDKASAPEATKEDDEALAPKAEKTAVATSEKEASDS